jgi:hypothetical protein
MCHLIKQLTTFHFGGHSFINPLEVMFTSAVGFGEHFLGVDKSQCSCFKPTKHQFLKLDISNFSKQ